MTDLRKAMNEAWAKEVAKNPHTAYNSWCRGYEAALAQPEQSNYSDIVSDGGLDPRNKFDAQPEQEPEHNHLSDAMSVLHDVNTELIENALDNKAANARELGLDYEPEQEPVCSKDPHLCGFVQCQLGKVCKHTAQPEQFVVSFPSFMRKRIEQALKDAINPKGMSVHDGKANVLASDLSRMLLVIDSTSPRKTWVGLTDEDMHTIRDDAFVKNVDDIEWALQMVRRIEAKLKEKNGG